MHWLRLLIILFCLSSQPLLAKSKWFLTVATMFQNEARFLKEWIEYHKLMGVDHFLLYNHQSSDNYEELLLPYIQSGEVELFQWNQLMIERLTLSDGAGNVLYKSIVKPHCVDHVINSHACRYKRGYTTKHLCYGEAQINHYWSHDEEFFYRVKMPRRQVAGNSPEACLEWAASATQSNGYSKQILRFVPALKRCMGLTDREES